MQFTLQLVLRDEQGDTRTEDVFELNRPVEGPCSIGLSLQESKTLLKSLQKYIVQHQAAQYTYAHRACTCCRKLRRIKGNHTLHYRTLFGIVPMQSLRVFRCACEHEISRTVSPLTEWITEHNSSELQYIETKWASLMSYGVTAELLKDVLPVGETLNAATVRHHLQRVAQRQDSERAGRPDTLTGCPHLWGQLPKPGKPMVVGIDGGYLRNWHDRKKNFEIIAGEAFSKTVQAKRFGLVQQCDDNPRRRLLAVLQTQGMQANQQITFLSDGADNVRNLQQFLYPESENLLDWFHVTVGLTVLNQFALGVQSVAPEAGATISKHLDSAKWYLWHGNGIKALDQLNDCYGLLEDETLQYGKRRKFMRYVNEMVVYISNNQHMIPNYGEKYRCGETITTAFVESTINEVVAKRMAKKQQMQWSHQGAHCLLQTRTAVLNGYLQTTFERWYPGASIGTLDRAQPPVELKRAA